MFNMLNTPDQTGETPAMLGLRLEPALRRQLAVYAHRTGRTKSEVAREAVREYLARHDEDAEFKRQVMLLNQRYTSEDDARMASRTDEWLQMLHEEDGGYDWGGAGPPQ